MILSRYDRSLVLIRPRGITPLSKYGGGDVVIISHSHKSNSYKKIRKNFVVSIFIATFAVWNITSTRNIASNILKSILYVRKSPSQHGIIKGTISRAEVIGARDNRGRLIIYKRLPSYSMLYQGPQW
jgi:hypothetical protein